MNFTKELNLVIDNAIELTSRYNHQSITESILFMGMLMTPISEAYRQLEAEGYQPTRMYEKAVKKLNPSAKEKHNEWKVNFSEDLEKVIMNIHLNTIPPAPISSLTLLNYIRQNNTFVTKFLEMEKTVKVVEPEPVVKPLPKILLEHCTNLNECAQKNQLDKIASRSNEINRVIHVLERRTKNNPCLVGLPGVGKSAIAEGLAQMIVEKVVPLSLQNKIILSVDIASIVAGCRFRGDFEERFKTIVKETIAHGNIILFIDEIHSIIGAGDGEGAVDAGSILKPYMSRGMLKIIGATTLDEYKKKIEKDSALERRLQQIVIEEPTIEAAIEMLTTTKDSYEQFHHVTIEDEAIESAVTLSSRYVMDRFLPDKAVDVLDEACVQVKLSNGKVVSRDHIAKIIHEWTKIPVESMDKTESDRLINLEQILNESVIGQSDAVRKITNAIRRSRAGIADANKPIGSFLFLGPSGTGKTYLCRQLARVLFDNENAIIRFDMSEFMEKHSVSKLIGSPPGYVGYDEGGQLTDRVRRQPYSILLFDEIEKAAPEIFNILLQIMDEGRLTDSQGRTVNFRNTLVVLTSNLGSSLETVLNRKTLGFASGPGLSDTAMLEKNARSAIKEAFRPEFINRLDEIVIFNPLGEEEVKQILGLTIAQFKQRLKNYSIRFAPEVVNFLSRKGYDKEYGARPMRRAFQDYVENPLSLAIIDNQFAAGEEILADIENEQIVFRKETP